MTTSTTHTDSRLRSWVDRHRIASFLLVTYAFTWSVQSLLRLAGLQASWTLSILVGFGAFGPPLGAAVVIWATGGSLRTWIGQAFKWRLGLKWWLLALGLPFVVLLFGSGVYALLGGPIDLSGLPFVGVYLFVMVWGIVWGGGQEELGWRGFMLPVLQERYSALTASLFVGVAWAGWHLPLLLNANTEHGSWPLSQQLIWAATILAGSILWTWMYNGTGGSVLAVAVFHAGMNAIGTFHPADRSALIVDGVPDPALTLLAEAASGVVLVGIAAGIVLLYGKTHLSRRRRVTSDAVGLDVPSSPATRPRDYGEGPSAEDVR